VRAGSASPEPAGSAASNGSARAAALVAIGTPPFRRRTRWLVALLACVVALLAVRAFVLQVVWVPTGSMVPTFVPGDRVLVDKAAYWLHGPRTGDVIVFRGATPEPEVFVKRVIALPGQTWEIRGGTVYVNGRALREPYVATRDDRSFGPGTVPPGKLFVLGDDRPQASDSRFPAIGYVPTSDVIGRAIARVWPLGRAGWL
jgi:signal peptidase I